MKPKIITSLWSLVLFSLACGLRFWNVEFPTDKGGPVFDENHYAPQAYQILTNGTWMEDNPSYGLVVHPPVGKWCIALGEWIFGYNPLGWRFSSVLFGAGITVLIFLISKQLTNSLYLGLTAGFISLSDSVLFVSSRMAMLDIFLAFFILLALWFLILDQKSVNKKTKAIKSYKNKKTLLYGSTYGIRWYRTLAALTLGIACGVKWSGAYYAIGFAILSLWLDFRTRNNSLVIKPFKGTLRYDLIPTIFNYFFIVLIVYLSCNWAWFYNDTSIFRYQAETDPNSVPGWGFLPDSLRSFWYYQKENMSFHTGLTNSAGHHHSWESKPWTWPMSLRPILYYFQFNEASGTTGATVSTVLLLGSPIMWWVSVPILIWGIWRALTVKSISWTIVSYCYALGLLPWFINMDRQMYFFYATLLAPSLVMAITLTIRDIIYAKINLPIKFRLLIISIYLGLVILNFIWLWPILTGKEISAYRWYLEMWLPSWS